MYSCKPIRKLNEIFFEDVVLRSSFQIEFRSSFGIIFHIFRSSSILIIKEWKFYMELFQIGAGAGLLVFLHKLHIEEIWRMNENFSIIKL